MTNKAVAYFLLRLVLGLNITMHGVARLLAGPSTFADGLVHRFAAAPLPLWSVHLFALCLPWTETIIGLGILLGAATRLSLIAGVLEIAVLTFGATLQQDWESAGLQLTYAFVYAALLAFLEYNTVSIDGHFGHAGAAEVNPNSANTPTETRSN